MGARKRPQAFTPVDRGPTGGTRLRHPKRQARSRAVQIILAMAWDKLADQAEEWHRQHPSSAAA